jgi:ABC-2 type transport system permease protein
VSGFRTLVYKELLRASKVSFQTIFAPIVTAFLYLLVFAHVIEDRARVYDDVPYREFLVPGLVMMSILQNAFANSSSSLVQSKMMGNIVFVLLPPLSYVEFFGAYVVASVVRAVVVGLGVLIATAPLVPLPYLHPLWIAVFALVGGTILGALGVVVGIWSEKIDQLAGFTNFFIVPATFLSGVFYSIHSLPPFWQGVSHLNPFFYLIDGFLYGFFGKSDASPLLSFGVVAAVLATMTALALAMLRTGYRLRH